jgi:hypothetical protein
MNMIFNWNRETFELSRLSRMGSDGGRALAR